MVAEIASEIKKLDNESIVKNNKITFLEGLKQEFIEQGLEPPTFKSEFLEISSADIIRLNNEINRAIEDNFVNEHKSLTLANRYRCRR